MLLRLFYIALAGLLFAGGATAQDKSYYKIGLKFKTPTTNYLKQLRDLALAKKI